MPNIPLFWGIKQNIIEKSYIEWLSDETPIGKYLITWPWRAAKFIPILVSEYLMKNPRDKIIVITEYREWNNSDSFMTHLPVNRLFEKLIYVDTDMACNAIQDEQVEKDIKWFTRTQRLRKFILKTEAVFILFILLLLPINMTV